MKPICELVLSGGGTNGTAIVGCLQALYENGILKHIERWIGSSAGCILSLLMVLGYTPQSIYKLLLHLDFSKLNDADCDSVLSFFDTMGVIDGEKIMQVIYLALIKKGYSKDITFCELFSKTQKELVITGYNLTKGCTEAFSVATTPYMKVHIACRISISVPFLFKPVVHNGHMFLDGSTIEHSPIRFAKEKEKTLIIQCVSQVNWNQSTAEKGELFQAPIPTDIPSFFALLHSRICGALQEKCLHKTLKKRPYRVMSIPIQGSTNATFILDFAMGLNGKKKLFLLGHETALRHPILQDN